MKELICEYKGFKIIEVTQIMGNKTYHVQGIIYTFNDVNNAKKYIDSIK